MQQSVRRLLSVFFSGLLLAMGLSLLPAAPAQAATVSADAENVAKSAGERYALRSEANGLYVSVDPDNNGRMTANASTVGSKERFTLHTNHAGKNIALRSEATGFFATSELGATDNYKGMMQARGGSIGTWQQFTVESRESDGPMQIALKSVVSDNEKYISVEHASEGDDKDMLRARASSVGSWERFTLLRLGQAGTGGGAPTPAAAPASDLNVMTWNVCANNNPNCWDENLAGKDQVSAEIAARLPQPGSDHEILPDVIFFQEFCEKHAKPVEQALEARTGREWDVRFAPTQYSLGQLGESILGQYGVMAQKECAKADGLDRGSFGVALAVPAANTYYKGYTLQSPVSFIWKGEDTKAEQRPALCADLPERAVQVCTSHFSAGEGLDDPDGVYRKKQAAEFTGITELAPAGYHTVFGGDLNSVPPDSGWGGSDGKNSGVLSTMYASYRECAQLGDLNAARKGPATANAGDDGKATMKIDYIFAQRNAPFRSCAVSSTHGSSDHWTLYGTVALPAS
ncbi:endonuclease/exonuclease/phosphatase family protein [Streptomyces sp. RY43-2]|uniref:Endonuclease/exonuclease/phosphatase family protein n=1 Tax=Streptomyces macrolidinus TaxID=2952607 RepID=A0ABT0ZJE9_9ACTN|nr:endonuclease/exonuclease/phosphatase family protein [Streptomyces macrolidinus]MCN9243724.1 endonuclease/exonuclease/phosphatase family protein [Streptomyces macrolidinus]